MLILQLLLIRQTAQIAKYRLKMSFGHTLAACSGACPCAEIQRFIRGRRDGGSAAAAAHHIRDAATAASHERVFPGWENAFINVNFGVNNSWIMLGKRCLARGRRAPPELEAALGILQGKPAGDFLCWHLLLHLLEWWRSLFQGRGKVSAVRECGQELLPVPSSPSMPSLHRCHPSIASGHTALLSPGWCPSGPAGDESNQNNSGTRAVCRKKTQF